MEKLLQDNKVILKLHEDLIAANVRQYNMSVVELLEQDMAYDELVLDLSETENIDSVGVTFVISLYKTCLSDGKAFRVSGGNDDIIQLFRLMKLDEFFDLD